jgi:phospholipid/cholesterol/gamma-HCH transport system substrate-binding protein
MKLRIRFAEQVVGAFVLLAIVGVGVILVFIGINQRWFARNYYFISRFASGDGLAVGMPIMLKGFEIGRVSRIRLDA